jgi:type IV fimbrial biogenesis protein FimT
MQNTGQGRYCLYSRGFTLTELIIAMAVLAIILAIGLPSLQQFVLQNRIATSANEILAGLAATRSEAIRRNTRSRFCLKTNELVWELRDFATPPNTLRQGDLSPNMEIASANLGATPVAGAVCVDYHSDGLPYQSTAAFGMTLVTNGSLTITHGSDTRTIRIKTGSVYVE